MATKMGTLGDTIQATANDEAISQRVVEAVADARGVDPLDLPPLYDSIDPDALDALFDHADSGLSITELRFELEGCEVLVRGSGEIVVTPFGDDIATDEGASQTDRNASRGSVEDRCGIDLGLDGRLDTHHG